MPRKKSDNIKQKAKTKVVKKSYLKLSNNFLDIFQKIKSLTAKLNRKVILVVLAILLILGFLYAGFKLGVVALVDKTPVTRIEMYKILEQKYGQQLKEQLIVEKLVINEAAKRNVSVSDKEINDELKKIEDQFGSKEVFDSWLAQQMLSLDDLKKDIRLRLLVFKMFEPNIKITDQEINTYVEQNRDQLMTQFTSSTPGEEELKNEAKQALKQSKITQEFRSFLENAKKSRVIEF